VYNGDKTPVQKSTHFTVSENELSKFPWGRLGGLTPHILAVGVIAHSPHRLHGVGDYGKH